MWRVLDRIATAVIPRRAQLRLAYSMIPVAVTLGAMGLVAVGVHVGENGPAMTSGILASSALRGAEQIPPAVTKPTAAATTTTTVAAPVAAPVLKGALPVGKGMWMYMPKAVEGGDPHAIVARAKAVGLTHIFVRTGSSKSSFYAGEFLAQLLPVAHAGGIRIYGWDFPYLHDIRADVARAVEAIKFTTPDGHRIDGFSSDIEFPSMGVNLTPESTKVYGMALREAVGAQYPLIATVPRPSHKIKFYPYDQVVESFDAIAPMVYWLNREPVSDVTGALRDLAKYNKPVFPIGQAYDGAADQGPPGVPNRAAIQAFMAAAESHGANSVSFWSWQHASQEAWDAIKDAPQFTLPHAAEVQFTRGQVRAYQHLLTSLGFATPVDGVWTQATTKAVVAYQRAARVPTTGVIDQTTRGRLLKPFAAPILGL